MVQIKAVVSIKTLRTIGYNHLVFIANEKDGWKPCKRNRAHLRPFRSANGKKILRRPAFQSNAMSRNTDLLKALGQKQWATPEGFVYKKCEMDLVQDRKCLPAFSRCFRKFRLLYTSIVEVGSEYHTLVSHWGV